MSDLADIEQKFQFGTSAKFDFDIRNYDINDMMNILNISGDPSKLNYFSVKKKTNNVIQKLREDENLSSEMKNKFESFLKALEFFLIYKYNVKVDNYVMDKKKIDPSKLLANVKVNDGRGGGGGGEGGDGEMVSINTYKRKIIKRQLSFDTKFRPNYFKSSPANFKMVLATPLKNVIAMRLISLEFPNVVYDVDATLGTNEFSVIYHPDNETDFGSVGNEDVNSSAYADAEARRIKYNIKPVGRKVGGVGGQTDAKKEDTGNAIGDTTTGWEVKYNIPSGNYQSNTVVAALNNFIIDDKIVFSIDTKTGRTVISTDISGSGIAGDLDADATFDLDFTNTVEPNIPMTKNFGWKLGFRQLKYSGSTTYISEAPVDFGGQKVLFFCIDDYRTNVCENVSIVYENSFMNRNIMARIPLRQGKFVVVYDDGSDNIRKSREYFGPVKIDKLHFILMDEYGIEVRQGYSDFSFGLEFDILYEK
jgi:hypothetical protein